MICNTNIRHFFNLHKELIVFLLIMNTLLLLNKIFFKKLCKIFGQLKKVFYFCAWRDGRVVDCGGLENRWAARLRGFESLSLRKTNEIRDTERCLLFFYIHWQGHCRKHRATEYLSLFFVKVSVELKLISLLLTCTKMRQSLAMFSCVESGITHLKTGVAGRTISIFKGRPASASPSESLIT